MLGDHYHKVKTEIFILVSGYAILTINSHVRVMEIGKLYPVLPGNRHTFDLTAGSVLIGLCSHEYDPEDDYK